MNLRLFLRPASRFGTACVVAAASIAATAGSYEASFLAESNAAMSKMMAEMAIKPSGDVDRDFATMMIPHHQGAIEMAESELRYGRNEQLRRLAQEIIVDQGQEIAVMRLALEQALPASLPASTAPAAAVSRPGSDSHVSPLHSEHPP